MPAFSARDNDAPNAGVARVVPCVLDDEMAAYDRLPARVKFALRNAQYPLSAIDLEQTLNSAHPIDTIEHSTRCVHDALIKAGMAVPIPLCRVYDIRAGKRGGRIGRGARAARVRRFGKWL